MASWNGWKFYCSEIKFDKNAKKNYLHNQLLKFRYSKKATIIRPIFHFLFDITYLVSSNYKWKIDWPQFCDLLRISELYSKKLNCVDCRQLLGLNARKSCLWHVFLVYLVICGRFFFQFVHQLFYYLLKIKITTNVDLGLKISCSKTAELSAVSIHNKKQKK